MTTPASETDVWRGQQRPGGVTPGWCGWCGASIVIASAWTRVQCHECGRVLAIREAEE